MSREHVEVVGRAYEAFNRDGVDGFLEYLRPDVEFDATAANGPFAAMYHGRESVGRFLADYFESWEHAWMEHEVIEVGGDHVVVRLRLHMRGKGSGVEVSGETFNAWTLSDGKATRMVLNNDRAETLAAVGLPG
jgi:ketosteroid isomerase-like protein